VRFRAIGQLGARQPQHRDDALRKEQFADLG